MAYGLFPFLNTFSFVYFYFNPFEEHFPEQETNENKNAKRMNVLFAFLNEKQVCCIVVFNYVIIDSFFPFFVNNHVQRLLTPRFSFYSPSMQLHLLFNSDQGRKFLMVQHYKLNHSMPYYS